VGDIFCYNKASLTNGVHLTTKEKLRNAQFFCTRVIIMTKDELIDLIASHSEVSKKSAGMMLEAFTDTVKKELASGGKVAITGFGTFSVSHRAARKGVNPQNPSQTIDIPAVDVPKFKAGKGLKDAVK
jgi:DNA-binding protein HU-beta